MTLHRLELVLLTTAASACGAAAPPAPAPARAPDRAPEGVRAADPAVARPVDIAWAAHRFRAHGGAEVDAELGTFAVPENRDEPQSRAIELRFVRFPATTATPGPPIVYLAGGPGGSGIEAARGPRFELFMALRELGDVIALDQRGTGMSNAIPFCPAPEPWPSARPMTRETLTPWLERTARHCAIEWRAAGVDLRGYTTVQSADDLEDLRRGLGAGSLRVVAISYGTHLAMAAVRRHPALIDRMVLASAEGLDETVKLPARTEAFLSRLLPAPSRAALARALARLDRAPAVVSARDPKTGEPVEVGVGKLAVQMLIGYLIKNPQTQGMLPGLIQALDAGNDAAIAPYVLMLAGAFRGMAGMPEAMDAASGISARRRAQVRAQTPGTLLEDALNYPGDALARPLVVPDLGDEFRAPLVTDVPTLLLSGELDGRTYVESHRELAAGLSAVEHEVVAGAGHDLLMFSPAVTERIVEFLARPTLSRRGSPSGR